MDLFFDWAFSNKIELAGTIFGLLSVWFSIRQSLITWPTGILTSFLYCVVFLESKFYAGMVLQLYYLLISIYGWWNWAHGGQSDSGDTKLIVSRSSRNLWIRLFSLNLLFLFLIYFLLRRYTDSPIAFGDAFTTSLSIIATWMLARKKIEHWIVWVFIDLVSASLYLYRGLYLTVFLFLVYTGMAVVGFYEWQKELKKVSHVEE